MVWKGLSRPAENEPYSAEAAQAAKAPLQSAVVEDEAPAALLPSSHRRKKSSRLPFQSRPAVTEAKPEVSPDEWAGETPLVLTGKDAVRDAAVKRDKELLDKAVNSGAWEAYRGLLARSIRAGMDSLEQGQGLNRFDAVWNEAILYRALLRWKTLGCFMRPGFDKLVTDSYTGAYLLWLLDRPEAMEEIHLTIQPADDSVAVLKLLMDCRALDDSAV